MLLLGEGRKGVGGGGVMTDRGEERIEGWNRGVLCHMLLTFSGKGGREGEKER